MRVTIRSWRGVTALLVGVLALEACRDPSFPETVQARIRGTVTASAGFPAEGATVVFEVTRGSDPTPIGIEPATTDASGRFFAQLGLFAEPFDGLMTVRASWEFGGTSQAATVTDIPVPFRRPSDGIETVQVDMTLAPVAGQRSRP